MSNNEASRNIYLMTKSLLEVSSSVVKLLQEVESILIEPCGDCPSFGLWPDGTYGYASMALNNPKNRLTEFYGCAFTLASNEKIIAPSRDELFVTVLAQFYHPELIQQAELWFAVCRKTTTDKPTPVWWLRADGHRNWETKKLPEYGKWLKNSVTSYGKELMAFEVSRQPLGIFTGRQPLIDMIANPLRDKIVELSKRK